VRIPKNRYVNFACILTLYFGLALFYARDLVWAPGPLTGWDWQIPQTPDLILQHYKLISTAWTHAPSFAGYPNNSYWLSNTAFNGFMAGLVLLGLAPELIHKCMLLGTVSLAGLSLHFLLVDYGIERQFAVIASVLYVSTPIFLDMMFCFGPAGIVLTYAFFPLSLLLFRRSIVSSKRTRYAALCGITTVNFYPLHSILLIGSFLIAYSLYNVAVSRDRKGIARLFGRSLLVIIFVVALSQVRTVLFAFASPTQAQLESAVRSVPSYPISLMEGMRLGGFYLRLYEDVLARMPASFIASFALPVMAFAALLIRSRRRDTAFYSLAAIISIGFYGLPVGWYLVQENILFLGIFRDLARVLLIASLCVCTLFAFSIDDVYRYLASRRRKLISLALTFLMIVPYVFPLISGQMATKDGIVNFTWPSGYENALRFVRRKGDNHKVLWLPTGTFSIQYPSYAQQFTDFYGELSTPPGAVIGLVERVNMVADLWLLNQLWTPGNGTRLLGLFNIGYVINRQNITRLNWFTTYSSPVWLRSPSIRDESLLIGGNLNQVANFSNTTVYENTHNLPKIYAVESLAVATGGLEILKDEYLLRQILSGELVLAFAQQQNTRRVAEIASTIILRDGQDLDLLPMLVPRAVAVEPGLWAGVEMTNSWTEVHRWFWVLDDYQEELWSVAATEGPGGKLQISVDIPETTDYAIWIKAFCGTHDSRILVALDGNNELISLQGGGPKGFRWLEISNSNARRISAGKHILTLTGVSGKTAISKVLFVKAEEIAFVKHALHRMMQLNKIQLEGGRLFKIALDRKSPPEVAWKQLDVTSYSVEISGSTCPFVLVFLERFDPGWSAFVNGEQTGLHFPVLGYANAWLINRTGDFVVRLTYGPQAILDIGNLVTECGYATLALCLASAMLFPGLHNVLARTKIRNCKKT